jgi:hypothetical protein
MLRRFRDAASRLFAAAGDAAKHIAEEDACVEPPLSGSLLNSEAHRERHTPLDRSDVLRNVRELQDRMKELAHTAPNMRLLVEGMAAIYLELGFSARMGESDVIRWFRIAQAKRQQARTAEINAIRDKIKVRVNCNPKRRKPKYAVGTACGKKFRVGGNHGIN